MKENTLGYILYEAVNIFLSFVENRPYMASVRACWNVKIGTKSSKKINIAHGKYRQETKWTAQIEKFLYLFKYKPRY